MTCTVVTYEQRRAKILFAPDIDVAIRHAKAQMVRMRTAAKKAPTLELKLERNEHVKIAEGVLRRLRSSCFDIEDELKAAQLQRDSEGWCISDFHGSAGVLWQIQKIDDANKFESDEAAWAFVVSRADSGDKVAIAALDFIKVKNPDEHKNIIATRTKSSSAA